MDLVGGGLAADRSAAEPVVADPHALLARGPGAAGADEPAAQDCSVVRGELHPQRIAGESEAVGNRVRTGQGQRAGQGRPVLGGRQDHDRGLGDAGARERAVSRRKSRSPGRCGRRAGRRRAPCRAASGCAPSTVRSGLGGSSVAPRPKRGRTITAPAVARSREPKPRRCSSAFILICPDCAHLSIGRCSSQRLSSTRSFPEARRGSWNNGRPLRASAHGLLTRLQRPLANQFSIGFSRPLSAPVGPLRRAALANGQSARSVSRAGAVQPALGQVRASRTRADHWAWRRPESLPAHQPASAQVAHARAHPISRSRLSSRSASAAGLSQRMRWMRGKRIATPDLCRVERWTESKATSNTSACVTSRTGP